MTAGASRAAMTITPQPALAPSPQPRPAPTGRALIAQNVEKGGPFWMPIRGPDRMPIDTRRGQQGALSYFEAVGGNLDFEIFEPRQFAADGELVFVRGRTLATVKSTGR